jgi:predicted RNase H-like nuclease (RuvC/YqgF family)
MSPEPPAGWINRRVRAAMRNETDALRAAITALADTAQADRAEIAEVRAHIAEVQAHAAELRAMIEVLSAELHARAEQADAGLNALREAMDRDERIEALRLRLDGFSAQHRWDIDQLRQALAAMAERLPLAE